MKTWNRERKRTRDRLLEYDFSIVPPTPHSAGLPFIYPWENISTMQLAAQFKQIAEQYGYTGSLEELFSKFANGVIISGTINTFPIAGNTQNLYLDTQTDILYYFKTTNTINYDAAEQAGAVIVNTEQNEISVYIPIRALLIENIILSCGDASEYID